MEIDDVHKIAHLARLSLDDDEAARYAGDLNNILGLVELMTERDTSNVKPMSNPHDATQRLREDVVTETVDRDHFQRNAPLAENGLYLVPRVLD